MDLKFWYMKALGFLMVVVGFMYSLTSLYNFFDAAFGEKILVEGVSVWIMSIGLLFPIFLFVLGVYFYFYADLFNDKPSKWVLICIMITFILSIVNISITIKEVQNILGDFSYLTEFVHYSFGYVLLLISTLLIFGKKKYHY